MPTKVSSETTTQGIRIRVFPEFMPEESNLQQNRYTFSYSVIIANESTQPVTLISRHWIIIDGNGNREDVEGAGVIGQTPTIEPGAEFEYSSYCPLTTPWGTMEGSYQMQKEDGETFEAMISRFYLASNVKD
jgi:ApaG protein